MIVKYSLLTLLHLNWMGWMCALFLAVGFSIWGVIALVCLLLCVPLLALLWVLL